MSGKKAKTSKAKPAPKPPTTVEVPMIAGRRRATSAGGADKPVSSVSIKSTLARKPANKMSALDAAARVLAEAGKALSCQEMVDRAIKSGLWKTAGKTPAATVYSAVIREIAKKGPTSRFRKTDRGRFTIAKPGK